MTQSVGTESRLVSVGLPTYNRAEKLRRAIASVLAQDYANIQLVISDNGSSDETEALCRDYAKSDARVKYIRHPKNQGSTLNFICVLTESDGEYFMWLGDDDRIDPNFVSECLTELDRSPDTVLVGGVAKYYSNGQYIYTEPSTNLLQNDGVRRMLAYLQGVNDNGIFYGIWRKQIIKRLPCENTMGADWLTLAAAAYVGKVATVSTTSIHRDLGGYTVSFDAIADEMELPFHERHFPYLSVAINSVKDILYRAWPFNELPRHRRFHLATRTFFLVTGKYVIRSALISMFVKLRAMMSRGRSRSSAPPA